MAKTRIAIVGLGKIARDQHIPAIAASDAFELRCEIREKLIEFLQREYPTALPHTRAETMQRRDEPEDAQEPRPARTATR